MKLDVSRSDLEITLDLEGLVEEALNEGAEILAEETRSAIQSVIRHPDRSTGDLVASVTAKKAKKVKGGGYYAAVAFQGRLEGKDDYILDVVFYPDLPGEYIFLLRNVKGNERENASETTTESEGQNAGQNSSQAQNSQSNTPSQEISQSAVAQQNPQPAAQPQNPYDATNLSVKKIPETLLNYLDNRYEFQYDLYDWLYHHGKREVSSASVTDYSIDGDSRTATIELALSDGSSMTAVYNKSSNTYSFER